MAIMAMGTVNKKLSLICVAVLSSVTNVNAGEWQITPSIYLEENFTDNVELTETTELDSLVSQFGLNFDVTYKAKHAEFNLQSSSVYATYSHDHDLDDGYLNLDSSGRFLLWPDGIALVFNASIDNESRNNARNALADIVSGDTVQTERYSGGFEYQASNSDYQFLATALYSQDTSDDGIGEQQGLSSQIVSRNGNAARNIFWDVSVNYLERENGELDSKRHVASIKLGWITPYNLNPYLRGYNEDNTGNVANNNQYKSNSIGAGFRWFINPRIYFDVSYNTPEGDTLNIDGEVQDDYIDAEINWQPTSRTQVQASYGERFYGESYQLNIEHRNKRLTNTISYSEQVDVFTRNNFDFIPQGAFWCPIGTIDSNECYVSPGDDFNFDDYSLLILNEVIPVEDNGFSLNKNAAWNSELNLSRTDFNVELSFMERDNLETRRIDRDTKAGFSVNRQVSGYSNINLSLSYTEKLLDYKSDNERIDQYRQYALNYSRDLNSRFQVNLGVSHVNRDSSQEAFNYKESRATLSITKDF